MAPLSDEQVAATLRRELGDEFALVDAAISELCETPPVGLVTEEDKRLVELHRTIDELKGKLRHAEERFEAQRKELWAMSERQGPLVANSARADALIKRLDLLHRENTWLRGLQGMPPRDDG